MTIFPAAPGTYTLSLVRGERIATMIPVVGYHHLQGGIVFPLCPMPFGGLTRGVVLVTPDGLVSDPSYGAVFKDREEWLKIAATDAYWTAKDKMAAPKADKQPASEPQPVQDGTLAPAAHQTPASEQTRPTASPVAQKAIPDKPAGKPQVFINKTFWKTADEKGIFVLAGNTPAPPKRDARYAKITRDEFQTHKKAGAALLDDWQNGVIADDTPTEIDADDLI